MAWWLIILICSLIFSLINTIGNILKDETNIDETSIDFVLGGIFTWAISLLGVIVSKIKNKRKRK